MVTLHLTIKVRFQDCAKISTCVLLANKLCRVQYENYAYAFVAPSLTLSIRFVYILNKPQYLAKKTSLINSSILLNPGAICLQSRPEIFIENSFIGKYNFDFLQGLLGMQLSFHSHSTTCGFAESLMKCVKILDVMRVFTCQSVSINSD